MTMKIPGATNTPARPPGTAETRTAPANSQQQQRPLTVTAGPTATLDLADQTKAGGFFPLSKPALTMPTMDAYQMMLVLNQDLTETSRANFAAQWEGVKVNSARREQSTAEQTENRDKWWKNRAEAEKKAASEKVDRWIRTILGAVAAVAAMVFSMGMAAPIVAFAVIGVVLAVVDLANSIVQETGAKVKGLDGEERPLEISIGGMMQAIMLNGPAFKDVDPKKKQEWIMGLTIAVQGALAIGGLAAGGAGLFKAGQAAASGAKALSDAARVAKMAAGVVGEVTALTQGIYSATTSAIKLDIAFITQDAELANNEAQFQGEMTKYYTDIINEFQSKIEREFSFINELISNVSNAMALSQKAGQRINHNI